MYSVSKKEFGYMGKVYGTEASKDKRFHLRLGLVSLNKKWEWIRRHPLMVSLFFLKDGLFLPEKS